MNEAVERSISDMQKLVCNEASQIYADRIAINLRAVSDGRNHPDDPEIKQLTLWLIEKFKCEVHSVSG